MEEVIRMADVTGSLNLRLWNIDRWDYSWVKRIVHFINFNETYRVTLRAKCLPLLSELNLNEGYTKSLSDWVLSFKETKIMEMGILRDMLSWAIDLDKLKLDHNWGHLLYSPKRQWHVHVLKTLIYGGECPTDSHVQDWLRWLHSTRSAPLVTKIADTMVHNQEVVA
jgi:hypothetical protein